MNIACIEISEESKIDLVNISGTKIFSLKKIASCHIQKSTSSELRT